MLCKRPFGVLLIAALGAVGCATEPPSDEEIVADWFDSGVRRIGVAAGAKSGSRVPYIQLETSTTAEEAGEGAATGAVVGAGGVVEALVAGGPTMVLLLFPPTWIVVGGAGAAGAIVGGAVGAAGAEPIIEIRSLETVADAEPTLAYLPPSESMSVRLRDKVVERVKDATRHQAEPLVLANQDRRSPSELLDERPHLGGLIQVGIGRTGLAIEKGDEEEPDPSAALLITADAAARFKIGERLVSVFPTAEYRSDERKLSEWKTDAGRALREEVDNALEELSEEIHDNLFDRSTSQ